MAGGINIKVKGLNEALARIGTLPTRLERELKNEIRASADEIRKLAYRDAPKDQSRLAQSITSLQRTGFAWDVVVQNDYAAYQEWGTKGHRSVPAELTQYAALFKGPGPKTGISPVDALQAWVKRKGLAGTYSTKTRRRQGSAATKAKQDRALAFLIWRKIKREGVKAHPYFFKNVFYVQGKFEKKLDEIMRSII